MRNRKAPRLYDSEQYEAELMKEYKASHPVQVLRSKLGVKSLATPSMIGFPKSRMVFCDIKHRDKAILYRLIVAAYNYAFTNEFADKSCKLNFCRAAHTFVHWLNTVEIDNRYSILKDYETFMFDKRDNHGGLSELTRTKTLFTYAFNDAEFVRTLTCEQSRFLQELKMTRESPNLNKKQISLASFFGSLDWLRNDEIGLGSKLYSVFASPKMTVNSLRLMASVVILELYESKILLREFFLKHCLSEQSFNIPDWEQMNRSEKGLAVGQVICSIVNLYHKTGLKSEKLRGAIALLFLSNCQERAVKLLKEVLVNENYFKLKDGELSNCKLYRSFKTIRSGPFFSFEVLRLLSIPHSPLPVTPVEELMFQWLMAGLAVQPTDILKLTRDDFRVLRVNDRIISIECEYFKGRAGAIHNTRTLSTKKYEGRALSAYLHQLQGERLSRLPTSAPSISVGNNALFGSLVCILDIPFIDKAIADAHKANSQTPVVIPKALQAIARYGIHTSNIPNARNISATERLKIVAKSNTPCSKILFGLSAIKNSSVHAYSDAYTLHYLINRNSHTNLTERYHYLNEDNQAWMNAAGGVTRTVMLDLINNVFDLNLSKSKEENNIKDAFNHEFTCVTNVISYKSEEMLSRLKLVTEQTKGVINEVGVLSMPKELEGNFAPIYVLDSPVTVCKMRNYLYEFRCCYKKLLCRNPDYLYRTVLPTVEWMEQLLQGAFSRSSVSRGTKLFEKMHSSGVSMKVFHSL